jgi:hypothetical protein
MKQTAGAIPQIGTKEFNDSAMEMFGGKPKQQTAVEWLEEQLPIYGYNIAAVYPELIEQAKEMEKQQITDAYAEAEDNCEWLIEEHKWQRFHSEQYYNKTYNK